MSPSTAVVRPLSLADFLEASGRSLPRLSYAAACALQLEIGDRLDKAPPSDFGVLNLHAVTIDERAALVFCGMRAREPEGPWALVAPEIVTGQSAGPAADVYVLAALVRQLRRAYDGPGEAGYREWPAYQALNAQLDSALCYRASERPIAFAGIRRAAHDFWASIPIVPSREGLQSALLVGLDHMAASVFDVSIAEDGRRFVLGNGVPVDIARRKALRRILAALSERHHSTPGRALSRDEILCVGWPGEAVLTEAGQARVHVAIQTLRRLGLRDLILTRDDGYLLDASKRIKFEAAVS